MSDPESRGKIRRQNILIDISCGGDGVGGPNRPDDVDDLALAIIKETDEVLVVKKVVEGGVGPSGIIEIYPGP